MRGRATVWLSRPRVRSFAAGRPTTQCIRRTRSEDYVSMQHHFSSSLNCSCAVQDISTKLQLLPFTGLSSYALLCLINRLCYVLCRLQHEVQVLRDPRSWFPARSRAARWQPWTRCRPPLERQLNLLGALRVGKEAWPQSCSGAPSRQRLRDGWMSSGHAGRLGAEPHGLAGCNTGPTNDR